MKRMMIFLLAALLGSVAQADAGKMKAMREAFDRMDQEDFFDGIEKANECTQRRNFDCAEKTLLEISELVNGDADLRLYTMAAGNLRAEIQRATTEEQMRREAADRHRREQAARIAAEEAEERRQRREEEAESARVIGAAILSVGQSVGQAYVDIEASRARNQAVMDEYNEARAREQRRAAEARAEQARRDREERIAQQNYDRNRAASSAQLSAALRESRAQSQREAGISAYQQSQAATAALRTSSAGLASGVTVAGAGSGSAAVKAATAKSNNSSFSTSNSNTGNSSSTSTAAATAKSKSNSADYVASPEGVVICELKSGGNFACNTPLGSVINGGPTAGEGWRTPAEATAYVGGCRTPRRITWRSGYEVFGCGTGVTGMSNYIDVAAKLGVTVPGRNTYWCKPLEIACARTSKP